MISIIIPIYNAEKYISKCVDSILDQDYCDLEVLLINDGSIDNSLSVCKYYEGKDNRVRVIDKKNEGVSSARNIGIQSAKGDYVYFIDADDYIDRNALSTLLNYSLESNVDVVVGNYSRFDDDGELVKNSSYKNEILTENYIYSNIGRYDYFYGSKCGVQVWNKLYRLDFIKNNNIVFNDSVYFGEDFLFNFLLYTKDPKIKIVNSYTYLYFVNSKSVTNTYKKGLYNQYRELLTSMYDYLEVNSIYSKYIDIYALRVLRALESISLNTFKYRSKRVKDMKDIFVQMKNDELIKDSFDYLSKYRNLKNLSSTKMKLYVICLSFFTKHKIYTISAMVVKVSFLIKRV